MTTGFEKHDLQHTSSSQINMWAEAPCAWVAKYLYGCKFAYGVAPQIGTLAEKVVADTLMGASFTDTLEQAKKTFLRDNALNTSEKDLARIEDIEPMALNALEYLKPFGEPEFVQGLDRYKQQAIEVECPVGDGFVKIIGYLDFYYPKHGLVVDLKTTLRIPSEISAAHARQAAVYSKAKDNMDVKMLYVSPKKYAVHGVHDMKEVQREIKAILNRQNDFLLAGDKEFLKKIVPLNMGSFYWSSDSAIRKELYGI